MHKVKLLLASAALALTGGLVHAQTEADPPQGGTEGMDPAGMDMNEMPPAMQDFMGAMDTMMQNMPTDSSGDPDVDFLRMMIPHHQSAIDMARVVLEQGDDPKVKIIAKQVIADQEAEIAEIRTLLESMSP